MTSDTPKCPCCHNSGDPCYHCDMRPEPKSTPPKVGSGELDAAPTAWIFEREADPTFPRVYFTAEEVAERKIHFNVGPLPTVSPLYKRHALELAPMDPADDEALTWIGSNLMALRRDSGAMEYRLPQVVRAFQAGKALAAPVDHPEVVGVDAYKAENAKHGWSGRGFSFDPGFLNLEREGNGNIGFAESDMQYERDDETGKDYVYCNLAASEILALRDYLNEAFPLAALQPSDSPALEAGVARAAPVILDILNTEALVFATDKSAQRLATRLARAALSIPAKESGK